MTEVTREMRIAVAAEYAKFGNAVERAEKAAFLEENEVGTRLPVVSDVLGEDGRPIAVGAVTIKKAAKSAPKPFIEDEEQAIAFAEAVFGGENKPPMSRLVLTPQGRSSVMAAAEKALEQGETLPPGVALSEPSLRSPSVEWRPAQGVNAGAMLAGMADRGVFRLADVLALEPARPGDAA